jgi:DNA-binding transcriptional MerR regulator
MLRSGELARQAGVSPDTLRHYERMGVLPQPTRASNGYRQYEPESLDRVRLVRRALALGFTLDELRRVLAARERGTPPCAEVRRLAVEKLAQLDARLSELTLLRKELRKTIRNWDTRLARTPRGEPARLLESLKTAPSTGPLRRLRVGRFRKETK